jgi:hypothetical protein
MKLKFLVAVFILCGFFFCGVTAGSAQVAGLPPGTWTYCAAENTQCSFTGQALVEFGANGIFTGLTLTNGTLCSDTVFGDPDVGVFKSCYYQPVSSLPAGLPPGTWTFCANEWGQCSFTGQALVEFGASGHFTGLTLTNGTLCANTIFGDPDVGVAKGCYFQPVSSLPSGLPPGTWTLCASEWGECSFTGQALVEFGASGHFTGLILNNGALCANTIFGDPDVGVAKSCYYQPTSVVTVAVAPANVSASYGATQQFTAAVTGEPNQGVTWALSGVGCGAAACGTISSGGLYTAPATMPSSANVTVTATSVADPVASGSGYLSIVGHTYYLANAGGGGSDSNNGLSPTTPWLTPSHTLSCGDIILAAPGLYSAPYFNAIFGTVNCPTQNNVAWLKCAVFDGCKISAPQSGLWVNQSYWGVEGWEVTTTGGTFAPCFFASPINGLGSIHHVVFADDIANGCYGSGFSIANDGQTGVDYLAIVGDVVYNAAQGSAQCFSGVNISAAGATDTLPGTHIYIGGNFAWDTFEPQICNGGPPTDGEGIVVDTLDALAYAQQVVIANNMTFLNGSSGIKVGIISLANLLIVNNTSYANNADIYVGRGICGEIVTQDADNIVGYGNLLQTIGPDGCANGPVYDIFVQGPYVNNAFYNNFGYSVAGYNTGQSGGFVFGPGNIFGVNPNLANPPTANPGPPSCSSYSSVPSCMATQVANLTPANPSATSYGYHTPGSAQAYDPLFPQWLCNVNLPVGLVPMGCQSGQ